jgi:hypothetical protein
MGILPTTRHAIKPTFFEHDVPSHRGAPQRNSITTGLILMSFHNGEFTPKLLATGKLGS